MSLKPFTIAMAIQIQQDQLAKMETVLNSATIIALHDEVDKRNQAGYKSGYDVFRGQSLWEFVANRANKSIEN